MATAKILGLFIKTLSKPLAKVIKAKAKSSSAFKNTCMEVAQSYHRIEIGLKMKFLDYKSEPIQRLSDAKAVELGADFISEMFVFTVAVGVYMGETYRKSYVEKSRRSDVDSNLTSLLDQVKQMQLQIQELQESTSALQEKTNTLEQTTNTLK